jgi:hypothetical protein
LERQARITISYLMTEFKSKMEILRCLPVVGSRIANWLEGAPTVGVLRLTGVIGQVGMGRRGGLSLAERNQFTRRISGASLPDRGPYSSIGG